MSRLLTPIHILTLILFGCFATPAKAIHPCGESGAHQPANEIELVAKLSANQDRMEVFRRGEARPVVTHQTLPHFRPYLHPIVTPDGNHEMTQFSPGHHRHQTGIFWGFTRINDRDFFHHPGGDYWRRVATKILKANATGTDHVQWQTVYDLLDEDGNPILRESQIWSLKQIDGTFELDLQWNAEAQTDISIGKYDYGGLFLRMPWQERTEGRATNSLRQDNQRAEGQRAVWLDVGLKLSGRRDFAHFAIFDHPSNHGFPQHWRVDGQLGVGPVPTRDLDWKIDKGETVTLQHRLIAYTGPINNAVLTEKWSRYSGQDNTWAQWGLAQQEGRRAKFLNPQQAAAAMTTREGFQVNVFAAEPDITQPMAFCWDDRGRLWVAENRDYENRQQGFSKFGDSRILILEDTDHDGVADKRTVFLEGIPFPSAIAVGFEGLWLGAVPNLLFVPDRNGDDRADLESIEVHLTGWGIRDRHETLNSFHWGRMAGCTGARDLQRPPRSENRLARDVFTDTRIRFQTTLISKVKQSKSTVVCGDTIRPNDDLKWSLTDLVTLGESTTMPKVSSSSRPALSPICGMSFRVASITDREANTSIPMSITTSRRSRTINIAALMAEPASTCPMLFHRNTRIGSSWPTSMSMPC
jgi:putative membrane-bound dehydrogenase-like protein